MILDVHTHRPAPYPEGIISLMNPETILEENPKDGSKDWQAYSAGIHPWNTATPVSEETWQWLETMAEDNRVVAIGECGVDLSKGGPLYSQLLVLKRQIAISESVKKPLILHCVKTADIILGLKRDLQPLQPWIIHGFRGKPELMRQLTGKGIFLSFGEKFNPETVMAVPSDRLLAETDESALTITEIIGALSLAANRDLTPGILSLTSELFKAPHE